MKKPIVLLSLVLLTAMLLSPAHGDSVYSLFSTSLAGASPAKLHNITKAAAKINGLQLPRGQVFSFNDLVGPRTKASGYLMEENGVGDRVFGGGVAQIATTLDMALQGFDGSINHLERHTWGPGFKDSYAPSGDQAVRVSYSEGYNYAFTDNFQTIQIDVWVEDQQLFCLVKGKGDTPGQAPETPEETAGGDDIVLASLQYYDPASYTGTFSCFEMLRGAEAVDYLVRKGYYSKAEAQGVVDGLSSEQFVPRPVSDNIRHYNLSNMSFMLLFQPSGEPEPGGVPSSSGDFREIYKVNASLLTENCYYRIHLKGSQPVYLEQFVWP